ncbi:Crp/Fnr family transcriptional regulator [Algoriphagus halophilus]|uniref:cAMP-binding domain of CRP or a regulatory subunit of cAMP-dependent protein kinases n=1 Tax=Algoriphagus halophilus TaxID=226505 RepID=A0A1N6HD17_9BACT|nr:Crp/Fnr family transcriptional regulator [Algoriphagus halophilus]SIO17670.1 cAMP-binding domain of CRP or a regulatory subunit of cAMP-dependent protein kinases [Algoriphagus halophilus]
MGEMIAENACLEILESHISTFLKMAVSDFEMISAHFTSENINSKVFLQAPGGMCKFEYFVVKGLLQHSYMDESGKEFTLSFPHENWWAGDFKSFKHELPTDKSLISLEPTCVLKISRPDFLYLLENSLVFERYIAKLSENNSIKMQERVLADMSSNLEEKVGAFYQNNPLLVSRLSQKRIASFLGVSQEHLSKVLNKRKELPPIDQS